MKDRNYNTKAVFFTVVSFLLLTLTAGATDKCAAYNTSLGPFNHGLFDGYQHKSGNHASALVATGSCKYTAIPNSPKCNVTATADSLTPGYADSGSLTALFTYHVGRATTKSGVATAGDGKSAIADTESAVAYKACSAPACAFSVVLSGAGSGGGFNLSIPSDTIWSDSYYYKNDCPGETIPSGGDGGCLIAPPWFCRPPSPLIVNTKLNRSALTRFDAFRNGFSSIDNCVIFDIDGNGSPRCVSWPKIGSGLGWLTLPDKDGRVYSAKQLFGDHTPQVHHPSDNPNGFLALAEWDSVPNDLVINKKDPVWKKLRIWVDTHCSLNPNQSCEALPEELHKLSEFGINSISLVYSYDNKPDKVGNQFKLYSKLNAAAVSPQESGDMRVVYDVWVQGK